ncbi:MAG TPA: hypothetical protein VJ732_15510, partial [Bryobacteraceae bacterium]|nr:hypothetical protein [Bryobacteraceae bacterium]
ICAAHCPAIALFRNDTASQLMLLANAGQAKLVYEPKFFSAAYDQYGDGAILALLAHAIGHALDDAMGAAWIQGGWPAEVRADSWAGCELGKARLSAPDLAGALGALAKFPPAGHSAWNTRLMALRAGYTNCGGGAPQFDSAAKLKDGPR